MEIVDLSIYMTCMSSTTNYSFISYTYYDSTHYLLLHTMLLFSYLFLMNMFPDGHLEYAFGRFSAWVSSKVII